MLLPQRNPHPKTPQTIRRAPERGGTPTKQ